MTWPTVTLIAVLIVALCSAAAVAASRRKPRRRARHGGTAPLRASSLLDEADGDITLLTDRASLMAQAAQLEELPVPKEAPADPSLLTDILREARESMLDEEAKEPNAQARESRALLIFEAEAVDDERTGPVARVLVWAQGDSDQGRRRQRNEDAFLVMPEQAVFAVADGVGGYEGGQVASSLAVDAVRRIFVEQLEPRALDPRLPRRGREVAEAMLAANRDVFEAARANQRLANMGTTLVAARFALNKQRLYLGHVGDSRCYRLRNRVLRQLTTDHTMEQLGFAGPRAKDLTRAIGMEPHLELDLVVDKPCVDDIYLLCSDGLTKMVDDGDIRDVILAEDDLEAAVYNLIERANDAGGRDNITVLLVKVLSASQPGRPHTSSAAVPT